MIEPDNSSVISLKDEDSAFVVRKDGSFEVYIPDTNKEAEASESAMLIYKLLLALDHPDFYRAINEIYEAEMREMGYGVQ